MNARRSRAEKLAWFIVSCSSAYLFARIGLDLFLA